MSKNVGAQFTKSVLGIDTNARYSHQPQDLEERARAVLGSAAVYVEQEPTISEYLRKLIPTKAGAAHYFRDLFPPLTWIRRYNGRWLLGDVVAGK